MSEFGFEPGSESESFEGLIRVTVGDEEYEIGPDRASLFTFLGKRAMYDHVFIQLDKDDDDTDDDDIGRGKTITGVYVFSSLRPTMYEQMRDYMMDYDFPLHLNQREVADCDIAAYDDMVDREMADLEDVDTVPNEWLGGE